MPRKPASECLSELRVIASSRGGRLLSKRYVDDLTKLRFRCAEGHEWTASPGKIKQRRWCPRCAVSRNAEAKTAQGFARLQRTVARRGGTILTPDYVNSQSKLRFRCSEGHEWSAVPASVVNGTWCRRCAIAKTQERRRQAVFLRLQRRMKRLGGELLSSGFEGSKVPLRVRCQRGHERRILAAGIEQGVGCPRCKEENWLALVRRRAEEQGGTCLSKRCRDADARVRLVCARGHRFESTGTRVKRGNWCPKCLLPAAFGLERMRELARQRGGECLSKRYVDSAARLSWRCSEGHRWRARAQSVVRGTWCRICSRGQGKSRRALSIEIMRQMAIERGGECLSESYFGIYDRLRWRCARGHEWVSAANNVRRGGWCPECSNSILGTLERLRALAVERGGRCLTRKRNDHTAPLLFECEQGHRFRLSSNVVKTGVWCPRCQGRNDSPTAAVRTRGTGC